VQGGAWTKEELFVHLFRGRLRPQWDRTRQGLTTPESHEFEGAALTLCAALLARSIAPEHRDETYQREALAFLRRYRSSRRIAS
jgi:hypothetical protein